MPKPRITQDEWIEAVRNSAGVVALVAAKLGVSRQTIWEHRKKHAWLDEAFKETVEQSLDLAESNISAALQAGNLKATMWYLERKGKTRGFGRELQIESESLAKPQVILYLPDNGRKRKPQ
jgi:predicted transcriptional regulator